MKKALLLLSGGIDSPVAGELLKNKFELDAIHFSQEPFTDSSPEEKAKKTGKKIGLKELLVVEAGEELQAIADKTYREYYFVLMKIFFMKVSEKIARKKGAEFLITGESLGQVSSQTLSNLQSINSSVEIEILRPLLLMNKQEIINISREKKLYEISCGKEMCDALASGKPKTKTKKEKVEREIIKCNMEELVEKALKKIRIEKI
jgi:tRNA uracil 4-sulfurtransferase